MLFVSSPFLKILFSLLLAVFLCVCFLCVLLLVSYFIRRIRSPKYLFTERNDLPFLFHLSFFCFFLGSAVCGKCSPARGTRAREGLRCHRLGARPSRAAGNKVPLQRRPHQGEGCRCLPLDLVPLVVFCFVTGNFAVIVPVAANAILFFIVTVTANVTPLFCVVPLGLLFALPLPLS